MHAGKRECTHFRKTADLVWVSQHEGCFFGETSSLDNFVWDQGGLYSLLFVAAFNFSFNTYSNTVQFYYISFLAAVFYVQMI